MLLPPTAGDADRHPRRAGVGAGPSLHLIGATWHRFRVSAAIPPQGPGNAPRGHLRRKVGHSGGVWQRVSSYPSGSRHRRRTTTVSEQRRHRSPPTLGGRHRSRTRHTEFRQQSHPDNHRRRFRSFPHSAKFRLYSDLVAVHENANLDSHFLSEGDLGRCCQQVRPSGEEYTPNRRPARH